MAIVRVEFKDNPLIKVGKLTWLYRHARWRRLSDDRPWMAVDYGVPNTSNGTIVGQPATTSVMGYSGSTFSWSWS